MNVLVKVLDNGFSLLGLSIQSSGSLIPTKEMILIQRGYEIRIGLIFIWIEFFIPFGGRVPMDDIYDSIKKRLEDEKDNDK